MKYFSLEYYITDEDYKNYKNLFLKSAFLLRMKQMIFMLLIFAAMAVYTVVSSEISTLILFIMFIALSFTAWMTVNVGQTKLMNKKSLILKKKLHVDFYSDHFVASTCSDEVSKSYSEKHHGFDKVVSVIEAEEYFFFLFRTNNILIIPKRILTQEQFGMIKNLIDNLFGKIYKAI